MNSVWVTFTADWCPLVESLILQRDGDVVMGIVYYRLAVLGNGSYDLFPGILNIVMK